LAKVLLRALENGLEQRLLQYEDRGLVWAQEQHPKKALLRVVERGLVQGLVMGLERGLLQ
jgi:hypothetical protein